MTSITFDTLDASSRLRAAGLDERVATAIVEVVKRAADLPDISQLATKADIEKLEKGVDGLEKRFDDLRTLVFASMAFNLTGFLAVGGFLYAVLR